MVDVGLADQPLAGPDEDEVLHNPRPLPSRARAYPLVYRFRPDNTPDTCIWDTMFFHPFEGDRPPSVETTLLGPDDPIEDITSLDELALVLHQDAVQLPAV